MALGRADLVEQPEPAAARGAADHLPEHYRVRGRLKRRSGSPILVAVDLRDERPVVIKTGGTELAREGALLARLDHPGIVRLHDCPTRGGATSLILDYVAGEDLGARLRAGPDPLPPDRVEALLRALAAALAHLHERGVIHRDLKPENVLIRTDGTSVLADLGAALTFEEAADPPPLSALSEDYAAPEQFGEGGPEGPFTDIYGLAALAFRALTGRPPPPPAARATGLPELATRGRLGAAIRAALAPDPAARPADVRALLALLDRPALAASDDEMATMDDEPPPTVRIRRRTAVRPPDDAGPPPPPARRRGRRLVPLILLLAALGTGAAFGALQLRPLYERHLKTTWLVDPGGGGDTTSIADALARAGAGARITIRAGSYPEPLVLTGPIHLMAEDPEAPPIVAVAAAPCLTSAATGATIAGLGFTAASASDGAACLVIESGDLGVSGATIEAVEGPALDIRGGARPRLEELALAGGGIVVREGAAPVVARSSFTDLSGPALIVRGGATPEISANRILGSGPVVFAEGAGGRMAGNRIEGAAGSAIEVTSGARPEIEDNRIVGAAEAGVFVYGSGRPALSENQIEGSGLSGVMVDEGAAARLSGNRILGSGEHGILVLDGARAIVEGNRVSASGGRGIAIAPAAEVELIDNLLEGNAPPQLLDARPTEEGPGGDT